MDPEFIRRATAGNPTPEGGIGGIGASPVGNLTAMSAYELSRPDVYPYLLEKVDAGEIDPRSDRHHNVQDAMVERGDLKAATVRRWRAARQTALRSVFAGAAAKRERRWRTEFRMLKRAELLCAKSRRGEGASASHAARESAPRPTQRRSASRESRAGPGLDADPDEPPDPLARFATFGSACQWFADTRRGKSPAELAADVPPPSIESRIWREIRRAVERERSAA
jgi:hypothetical protein